MNLMSVYKFVRHKRPIKDEIELSKIEKRVKRVKIQKL